MSIATTREEGEYVHTSPMQRLSTPGATGMVLAEGRFVLEQAVLRAVPPSWIFEK
jgi:hypothetical protein